MKEPQIAPCPAPIAPPQPRQEQEAPPRYFALDSLRASMMLLGIYLHSVVGYSREGGWPYKDPNPTAIYDWTLGLIHAFRMPLFYVMAGFFAALLTYRRGLRGFLQNRVHRILLPFVVGWTLMYPVVIAMSVYSRYMGKADVDAWARAIGVLRSGDFLQHPHPLHLWFLEYLLLLYALQTGAGWLLPKVLPEAFQTGANNAFRWLLKRPWKAVAFAVPMFLVLCTMRNGFLEDPPGFIPVFHILLPYILSYAFGWFLYRNVDLLPEMKNGAQAQLAAIPGIVVLVFVVLPWTERHPEYKRYVFAAATSLVMWLCIFGLTGVFLRYLDRPMPRMRYMSDASYWLYIVHMPGLMIFQLLLRPVPWPAAVKVWAVLALAIPVMLLTYHYWVRPTFIGETLNGRKYPIGSGGNRG